MKIKEKNNDEALEVKYVTEPEEISNDILNSLKETNDELQGYYEEMTKADNLEEYSEDVSARLHSYKKTSNNLAKAYKNCLVMSDELSARYSDLVKGKRRKLIPKPPANALIDLEESRSNHFAKGMNIYKLMYIFYIGSFLGVVIEMLWCLFTRGYIEGRAGLVIGPFNLLYGFGAVAMSLGLYKFRNRGRWTCFFGGFLLGTAVEYICSWAQEMAFGSRSWDYSDMPFNINGRVCFLYSIFWGILSVFWVKTVYPWVAKMIMKIPEKIGKITAWVLLAFFIINAILTILAILRWTQRLDMIPPSNSLWAFFDNWFPNERMEQIFANMEFN